MTNCVGPFLLTRLLLPLLVRSGTPNQHARIVNVSSEVHKLIRAQDINLDDFGGKVKSTSVLLSLPVSLYLSIYLFSLSLILSPFSLSSSPSVYLCVICLYLSLSLSLSLSPHPSFPPSPLILQYTSNIFQQILHF